MITMDDGKKKARKPTGDERFVDDSPGSDGSDDDKVPEGAGAIGYLPGYC